MQRRIDDNGRPLSICDSEVHAALAGLRERGQPRGNADSRTLAASTAIVGRDSASGSRQWQCSISSSVRWTI
ncbi:hypothetical protein Dimus_001759, partial [Dionaea muscipula]